MNFRRATREDASTLVEFQLRMAWETEGLKLDRATCTSGVHAVFDDPRKGTYYVIEQGGEILVSTLIIPEWSDWRNGDVWWIHSVYVPPAHRRKGAFKKLYSSLKQKVLETPEVRGLRLYVDHRNANAKRTYEALGMNADHYALFEWMKEF